MVQLALICNRLRKLAQTNRPLILSIYKLTQNFKYQKEKMYYKLGKNTLDFIFLIDKFFNLISLLIEIIFICPIQYYHLHLLILI